MLFFFWIWPETNSLVLTIPQPSSQTEVQFLGQTGSLKWTSNDQGISIQLPFFNLKNMPSTYAWALKLTNLKNDFPTLIPIQNFWSNPQTDNAPVANQTQITYFSQNYHAARYEGLLFRDKLSSHYHELILFYSVANADYAAATKINQLTSGYNRVGSLGYVCNDQQLGYVPLDLYWSGERRDYYLVGSQKSYDDAVSSKYTFVTRLGFVFPGPFYFTIYQGHVVV